MQILVQFLKSKNVKITIFFETAPNFFLREGKGKETVAVEYCWAMKRGQSS